ncbi:THY1 Predicted alternative thymidylate synthase [uncultured Caudovirales phage]|uniref:THY1 Predicted alternative thymidylate synthase n=1 Tax=uncultured Caudovirales phage TaxID=2100421 RepID=A0A6J5NSW4_9CAUD|nr:THY1 Predicted alternative thymidylate synthase [uncultured Caudovirales phage]
MNTAKIIAVTQPTDGMTVDEFVAYVARVSNPSNQNNHETAPKLLRYLAKHKHWSPFEMVNIVMSIETTRDIARQILRHRSFSFQEFSQRYADPTQSLGFTTRQARLQDQKNRQNSVETDDESLQGTWEHLQNNMIEYTNKTYKWAIQNGIAKEQARALLPEGLTVSRMYMNGTLRSWVHYCALRSGPETQKEHREIALDAWYQISEQFPSLKDCLDIGI